MLIDSIYDRARLWYSLRINIWASNKSTVLMRILTRAFSGLFPDPDYLLIVDRRVAFDA